MGETRPWPARVRFPRSPPSTPRTRADSPPHSSEASTDPASTATSTDCDSESTNRGSGSRSPNTGSGEGLSMACAATWASAHSPTSPSPNPAKRPSSIQRLRELALYADRQSLRHHRAQDVLPERSGHAAIFRHLPDELHYRTTPPGTQHEEQDIRRRLHPMPAQDNGARVGYRRTSR